MATFEEKVNKKLDIKDSSVPGFSNINFTDQRLSVDSDPKFLEEYEKIIASKDIKDQDEIENPNPPSYDYGNCGTQRP